MSSYILKPQDIIALVCTGSPCESEAVPREAAEYLTQHYGFQTRYHFDTYKCLSAQQRAEIFCRYLTDDSIKVIWSVRGGEGSADILPYLERHAYAIRQSKPKLLIGFSDFTPILVYFQQKFCWPTLHGIGAAQLSRRNLINMDTEQVTFDWLFGRAPSFTIAHLQPLNPIAHTPTEIHAQLIGGNLTLLDISINDIWNFDPSGRILLLEEVNEKPYRVTRTLKYLQRINFFEGVKAILLAGFNFPNLSEQENYEIHYSMQTIFSKFALENYCPVLYTSQVSHGKTNYPVPFYIESTLKLGAQPSLSFNHMPISR